MRDIYLRPIGFQHVPNRDRIDEVRGALPLAGSRSLDFLGLEVLTRHGGSVRLRTLGLAELGESDWGREAEGVAALFDRLVWPRPPLGSLKLDRPRIMGILNVTPDSFSDGGRHADLEVAIAAGMAMAEAGAEIVDIGGESTRPGAEPVDLATELARVMPVIAGLAGRCPALLSIDTRKAEVMRQAATAGAQLINDVSALTHDPEAAAAVAETGLPVVLMHAQGDPRTMQDRPAYANVLLDVFDWLETRIAAAEAAGIARERILVDPGLGFGKTQAHNLTLLAGLSLLHGLGSPLVLGASRKSFIGRITVVEVASERVAGSLGAAIAAAGQGAQILRVHDVAATRHALDVWQAGLTGVPPQPSR